MSTNNQVNLITYGNFQFKGSIFLKKSQLDYLAKPSKYMTNYKRYKQESYETNIIVRNRQKVFYDRFKKDNATTTFTPFFLQDKNLFNNIKRHSTNQESISLKNKMQSYRTSRQNQSSQFNKQKIESSFTQRKTQHIKTRNTNQQIGTYISKIKKSVFRKMNEEIDQTKNDEINKKKLQIIADLHRIKQKRQASIQSLIDKPENQLMNANQQQRQKLGFSLRKNSNSQIQSQSSNQQQKQSSEQQEREEQYNQIKRKLQLNKNKNKIDIPTDFTQILTHIKQKRQQYSQSSRNKKIKLSSQLMVNSRGFNASSSFSSKNSTSSLRKILKNNQKSNKKLQQRAIIQKILSNLGNIDLDKERELRQEQIDFIKIQQFTKVQKDLSVNATTYQRESTKNTSNQSYCSFYITEQQNNIVYKTYFAYNENQKREIASLTKIMTCLLAIKICQKFQLNIKEEKIIASKRAQRMNGTTANLTYGDTTTVYQMLHGLMLPSGNDAAVAIAEWASKIIRRFTNIINIYRLFPKNYKFQERSDKKSYLKLFIYHMNKSAKLLGLQKTHYSNCHGLMDNRAYSTSTNICLLSAYAMQNQIFKDIVSKQNFKCTIFNRTFCQNRQSQWKNTNNMLKITSFQGIKTGITTSAGPCLASSFQITHKQRIIVCLLKANSMADRFKQTYDIVSSNLKQMKQQKNQSQQNIINEKIQTLEREWFSLQAERQNNKQEVQ